MKIAPWREGVLEALRESRIAAALLGKAAVELNDRVLCTGRIDVGACREAEQVLGLDAVMMVALGVLMTVRFAPMRMTMSMAVAMRVSVSMGARMLMLMVVPGCVVMVVFVPVRPGPR